jgi:hypothetical protein
VKGMMWQVMLLAAKFAHGLLVASSDAAGF